MLNPNHGKTKRFILVFFLGGGGKTDIVTIKSVLTDH